MHDAVPADELPKVHKYFAVECNNRAWRLAESPRRSPEDDREMLDAAHAAASRDPALHATHYREAKSLASALDDGDRRVFEATFRAVPAPL